MTVRALVLAWAFAALVGAAGVAAAPSLARDRSSRSFYARPAPPVMSDAPLDSVTVGAAPLAPFRADRSPPARRYDPATAAESRLASPEARSPDWTLTGVILGERPFAILDGAGSGGIPARLVAVGDEIDGYRVGEIRSDTVVVLQGAMSWILTLDGPRGGM